MKKRLLFLIHDLGGGGAEKVLVNLVNHMDFNQYDVYVVSLFGGGVNEKLITDKVHYSSVWKHPFPGNSHILRHIPATLLHQICIKEEYDAEIAYLEDVCAKVISGCKNQTVKRISWVHTDLHSKTVASRGFSSFEESQIAFESFDRIVCVSDTVRDDFKLLYPGIKRIDTCYNTLETDKILEMKDEEIDTNLSPDEKKLISVGKISENKGFDRLARILNKLRADGIPAHVYILGMGPDQEKITQYLEQNQLRPYYTFLGYQTNPYKYVSKCDLYVCASHAEGFSTAATEALIVGTPVCTVEVSGMKEMLGANNEWGVVVPNDDEALYQGIRRMLTEDDLLTHYKRQAERRGKSFSTKNTVKRVEELIEKVMAKN